MFPRSRISIVLALLLSLVFAIPVFAGGWAVITVDELPTDVVAGEPFTVGFTVLQHGKTPMNDLDPILNVHLDKTDAFIVHAKHDDKPGHYIATLTFPKAGEWEWSIQAFTMDQPMPALSVAAPVVALASAPEVKTQPVESASVSPVMIVRAAALGIGLVGLVFALRRKSQLAIALTALCFVVVVGSFMVGSAVPAVEAEGVSSSKVVSDASVSQVELGQQLFVTKGCVTCHVNTKVPNSYEYWTINLEGATNLSNFSASPEILRIRLKDPSSAKSDTQMPQLNLTETEIEALIAFINSN